MSSPMIVVSDLALDREIMSIRTWWTQDPRIAGTPLSVFLFFRGLGTGAEVTQTEAQEVLGLGRSAFRAAKERLRRAGFLVEVRDCFPSDYRDPVTDEPRGGQKRFQLWFLDPAQGVEVDDMDSLIEAEEPVVRVNETPGPLDGTKSPLVGAATGRNRPWSEKPQVAPTGRNRPSESATGRNRPSLEEVQVGRLVNRLVGSSIHQPTNQTSSARELADPVDLNAKLEEIAPGAGLSVAAITAEVAGRIDLSNVDLVAAVEDTLLRATTPVKAPAAYVASVLVRKPEAWPLGARRGSWTPPNAPGAALGDEFEPDRAAACRTTGEHDWGASYLPEIDRAHCVRCGTPRRWVDSAYAEFEVQHDLAERGAN